MSKKKQNYIPIQELLAHNSKEASLKLLKKYGLDADNTADLQYKLTEIYRQAPDKLVIEKEFAEIHPHSKWILKYLAPKEDKKEDKTIVDVAPTEASVNNQIKNTVVHDGYSNCSGNQNCPCNKTSNACGCSGFDGTERISVPDQNQSQYHNNISVMVFGTIAIFALLILKDKKII